MSADLIKGILLAGVPILAFLVGMFYHLGWRDSLAVLAIIAVTFLGAFIVGHGLSLISRAIHHPPTENQSQPTPP